MPRKTYPSDLTDRQWAVLGPHLPPARPSGRPRKHDLRAVVNALLYVTLEVGDVTGQVLASSCPSIPRRVSRSSSIATESSPRLTVFVDMLAATGFRPGATPSVLALQG